MYLKHIVYQTSPHLQESDLQRLLNNFGQWFTCHRSQAVAIRTKKKKTEKIEGCNSKYTGGGTKS